jgi:hypothetical protein
MRIATSPGGGGSAAPLVRLAAPDVQEEILSGTLLHCLGRPELSAAWLNDPKNADSLKATMMAMWGANKKARLNTLPRISLHHVKGWHS